MIRCCTGRSLPLPTTWNAAEDVCWRPAHDTRRAAYFNPRGYLRVYNRDLTEFGRIL